MTEIDAALLITVLKWSGTVISAGSALALALKRIPLFLTYLLWTVSSALLVAYALLSRDYPILLQQGSFLLINLLGLRSYYAEDERSLNHSG